MVESWNLNQGSQINSKFSSRCLIWGLIFLYFSVINNTGCQAGTVKKDLCPDGKIKGENDIVCHPCPLGEIPNPAKNGCLPCPKGMVSDGFNCSRCKMEYMDQYDLDRETFRKVALKIIGSKGVSESQRITSKELLRDTYVGVGLAHEKVLETLVSATGVEPDCIVYIKCPLGTKIKDLNCQPCHDGFLSDPLEESRCSNVDQPWPYRGEGNLFVTLSGDALEAQSRMGGHYSQFGWTSYWLNRCGRNAIWYNGGWNIGYQAANGSQLWKLDDNMLQNKGEIWMSDDKWNFKTKDDLLFYIENISRTKVLATKNDGEVILEDFEEDEAEQLWRKGFTDDEGYFFLINTKLPSGWVTDTKLVTAKIMTAISSSILKNQDPQQGGGNTAKIHSPDKVANPLQATTWKYASNDEWIESVDILIGKGDDLMGPGASLDCSASGFPKNTKNACLYCPYDWVLKGTICHPPKGHSFFSEQEDY